MRLSFCFVVKDSLQNVKQLFDNIGTLPDEIVVIDTGSDPEVVRFEKSRADKVLELPWQGDFAAMRNRAIEESSGEWILTLDSDETLTEELKSEIPKLIRTSSLEGFKFHRIHYADEEPPLTDYWTHLRLYRRHARYFGAIHESIKNLKRVEICDCEGCFILHHNNRQHQREKSLLYADELRQKVHEARQRNDKKMQEYYEYKLWVQENVYLLETDPKTDPELLKQRYKEYEEKKQYIEEKIKQEKWNIDPTK